MLCMHLISLPLTLLYLEIALSGTMMLTTLYTIKLLYLYSILCVWKRKPCLLKLKCFIEFDCKFSFYLYCISIWYLLSCQSLRSGRKVFIMAVVYPWALLQCNIYFSSSLWEWEKGVQIGLSNFKILTIIFLQVKVHF